MEYWVIEYYDEGTQHWQTVGKFYEEQFVELLINVMSEMIGNDLRVIPVTMEH